MRSDRFSFIWPFHPENRRDVFRWTTFAAVAAIFLALFPIGVKAGPPKLTLVAEFHGHEGQVFRILFSADGKTLVTSSVDGTVRLWTIPELKEPFPVNVESSKDDKTAIRCLPEGGGAFIGFLPDGKTLVVADQLESVIVANQKPGRVRMRLWDATARKECTPSKGERTLPINPWILTMTRDGNTLLSSRHSLGEESQFELWNRESGKLDGALPSSKVQYRSREFSPNGKLLAAASVRENQIKIWDLKSREAKLTITPRSTVRFGVERLGNPECIDFSPDGTLIAAGCRNSTIQVWNVETGKLVRFFHCDEEVPQVAFSPDGKQIAAGGGRKLYVWNVKEGDQAVETMAPFEIIGLVFSPNGKYIAAALYKPHHVQLWALPAAK